jgi:AMP-polyphosphate phosphotransferase
MLDQIDLGRTIGKREYKERLAELQARLYDLEQALFEARLPAIFVFEGWAGTAKVQTIGALTRRLDPRGLRVNSVTPPRTYETYFPWLHRFWLKIPSYGQIAIFDRSWYRQVIAAHAEARPPAQAGHAELEDIVAFERQLADDGTAILKFWLHIAKDEQRRRFKQLLSDRLTAWQVTEEDRRQHRHYQRYRDAVAYVLTRTHAPHAPWLVVPATDKRYARLAVLETVLMTLEARLGRGAPSELPPPDELFDASGAAFRRGLAAIRSGANGRAPAHLLGQEPQPQAVSEEAGEQRAPAGPGILRRVDLTLVLDQKSYERKLAPLQAQLYLLGLEIYRQRRPVVLVFEGWDAAGKGGAIKRVTEKLDPRAYVVHAIAAPSGDDKAHHYLYRFWKRLPPAGQMAIFDRSWYGRVLVERVEGFARPEDWRRAYAEINEFERQLAAHGTIMCKFWMHLSPEEQLRRFEERQTIPYKAWKLTDEDWRNRARWADYEEAADEMLLRTSTPGAPWTIVESEDKRFARVKVLQTVARRLEDELGKVKL